MTIKLSTTDNFEISSIILWSLFCKGSQLTELITPSGKVSSGSVNRRESAVVTLDKLFPSLRTEQPAIAEIMTDISVSLLNVFMVVRILVGRVYFVLNFYGWLAATKKSLHIQETVYARILRI